MVVAMLGLTLVVSMHSLYIPPPLHGAISRKWAPAQSIVIEGTTCCSRFEQEPLLLDFYSVGPIAAI